MEGQGRAAKFRAIRAIRPPLPFWRRRCGPSRVPTGAAAAGQRRCAAAGSALPPLRTMGFCCRCSRSLQHHEQRHQPLAGWQRKRKERQYLPPSPTSRPTSGMCVSPASLPLRISIAVIGICGHHIRTHTHTHTHTLQHPSNGRGGASDEAGRRCMRAGLSWGVLSASSQRKAVKGGERR